MMSKRIVFFLICFVKFYSLYSQQESVFDWEEELPIKYVVVQDSAFMDLFIETLQSDSIEKLLNNNFNASIKSVRFTRKGYLSLMIESRRDDVQNTGNFEVKEELLSAELKEIINSGSGKHIIMIWAPHVSLLYKYVTEYKGLKLFFYSNDLQVDGKNLFRETKRIQKYNVNLSTVLNNYQSLWFPFIYYDNKLYIEPDTLHWFLLTE